MYEGVVMVCLKRHSRVECFFNIFLIHIVSHKEEYRTDTLAALRDGIPDGLVQLIRFSLEFEVVDESIQLLPHFVPTIHVKIIFCLVSVVKQYYKKKKRLHQQSLFCYYVNVTANGTLPEE